MDKVDKKAVGIQPSIYNIFEADTDEALEVLMSLEVHQDRSFPRGGVCKKAGEPGVACHERAHKSPRLESSARFNEKNS